MPEVTAAAVASLRSRTGVSILACKKALDEAKGDEELAIDILRKQGQAQAVKKADRAQGEGYIFSGKSTARAALVLLRCETDFVARNADFQKIGQSFADLAAKEGAAACEKLANETLSLPLYPGMSNAQIDFVSENIIEFFAKN